MLLERYKNSGLLFNLNFVEKTSTDGLMAYRGELVLIEGVAADTKGHTKPPVAVMRGAVLLADEQLKLLVGALDDIAMVNTLVEKYRADFSSDAIVLLYIVNIDKPAQVNLGGINFILIPLVQGVPWNELIDELALEKSDFKGQSAADKILTVYQAMKDYQPKYPVQPLQQVLESANDTVRAAWGAV